ncbi:MAG: tetratricopeptide repeat protein [Bacteroidales bacterium]|nr:tetratricopeptide repeat protein [Bacteroidales bacterium]
MKKFSLILALIITAASFTYGQGKCRRHVLNCWSYMKDGFYDDAKSSIDKAMDCADTKDWYKTHWYKGQAYHAIGVSERPKIKALCGDNCLDEALDAYLKALTLNFVDPELKKIDLNDETGLLLFYSALSKKDLKLEDNDAMMDIMMNRLPALANAFINNGVDDFQNTKNYKRSLENFEKAILASTLGMQVDTQIIYFASLAAFRAEDFEATIQYNEALMQMNYGADETEKVGIYQTQAQCYAQVGDTAKMIETLQKGIEKYPATSFNLIIETFNYYVGTGQNEEAHDYISMAIEKNPNDPQFYVIKGTLLEQMGRRVDASKEYEKALELDEDNADAVYSMGAFYYNQAADTIAWANDNIPPTEFQAYDAVKDAADELFKKAIPFLEKSYALNPKDINILQTLRTVYYRLGEMEKHDQIKLELDALTE